jgi:alpha,alpha-trehalase
MPKFAKVHVPFAGILRRGVHALRDWETLRTWGAAVLRPYMLAGRFQRVGPLMISLAVFAFAPCAGAQSTATSPAASSAAAQPGLAPIRRYISDGWDTLTRSLDECKSIVDTKLTTASVLYMPADFDVPPAVQKLQAQCNVQAKHLPSVIHNLGEVDESKIDPAGLLYLPHKYVVPGGRFNEMYGWDS